MLVGLHGFEDLRAGDLVPGGGDDDGVAVVRAQLFHRGGHLLLAHILGAGEDDGVGVLDLVVEELAEVFHVHFALGGVGHGDEAVEGHGRFLRRALHGADHVAQLAHARRLDDDPVGVELLDHVVQGTAEIAHQGAANTSGVHFGDIDAGLLEKAAVDADLAEFVFDQHHLLALIGFLEQFFDQRGFSGTQEAGDNVYFRHGKPFFDLKFPGAFPAGKRPGSILLARPPPPPVI